MLTQFAQRSRRIWVVGAFVLGVIAARQGDRATAEPEFHEVLRCRPDFAEAMDNLGNLLVHEHVYP